MATAYPTHSFVNSNTGQVSFSSLLEQSIFQQAHVRSRLIGQLLWHVNPRTVPPIAHTTTKTGVLTKQTNDHCHAPIPEKIEHSSDDEQGQESRYQRNNSQAQGGLAKEEGTEDIGYAGTNR